MTGYPNQKRKLPGRFFWQLCGQTAGAVCVFFLVVSLCQSTVPEVQPWKQKVQQCFTTDADLAPVMQFFYTGRPDGYGTPAVMQVSAVPVQYEPMTVPVSGKVVRGYGQESTEETIGQGIWIATGREEAVLAAYAGTVTEIHTDQDGTWSIAISHTNGFVTRYSGCSQCHVQLHEPVKKGQKIATTDVTHPDEGNFHFAVTYLGEEVDPLELLLTKVTDLS